MHKTEGANNDNGWFIDPSPGQKGTTVEKNHKNAVQFELINAIEAAGLTLLEAATDTYDQLKGAIKILANRKKEFYVTSGTNSAYAITTVPAITAYEDGMTFRIEPHTFNAAGGVTLNVDGVGAKAILTDTVHNPLANQLRQGARYDVIYNATADKFVLASPTYYEITEARGNSTSLDDRINSVIDPNGYIYHSSSDCFALAWCSYNGSAYKKSRFGTIQYNSGNQEMEYYFSNEYADSDNYAVIPILEDSDWTWEITSRATNVLKIKFRELGTAKQPTCKYSVTVFAVKA